MTLAANLILLVLSTKVTRNLATVKRFECLHLAHSKHLVPLPTNSVGTIIAKATNLTLTFRVRVRVGVRLGFMHV